MPWCVTLSIPAFWPGFLAWRLPSPRCAGSSFSSSSSSCFWLKLRMEEKWMRSQFGETYATYARKTAALVPYLL